MPDRRSLLAGVVLGAAGLSAPRLLRAQEMPGVTATEIRIGNTAPHSGPVSAYGVIARTIGACFRMVNEQGGIAGRKINFITYDDAYSPPKTVEQVRRLIEQDRVAFLFNNLGTPTNAAVVRYVNQRKVPHLFLASGADRWGNPQEFPWTMGWQPSNRVEAQVYARHFLENRPGGTLAVLYQNDDFGKDYVNGVRDILGARFDALARTASYESTDATVDSQVIALQATGAKGLLTAATQKFAAQSIRRAHDIGWKPLHYLTNTAISASAVMQPAGPEKGVGVITSAFVKEISDPAWREDAGMSEVRRFLERWAPEAEPTDVNAVYAYGVTHCLLQVLRQCGGDLSRENIMRQATGLRDVENPILLPGIRINTSPTNYHPIRQMQLQRWDGTGWRRFGGVTEGAPA